MYGVYFTVEAKPRGVDSLISCFTTKYYIGLPLTQNLMKF